MKYSDLPERHRHTALHWAVGAVNALYGEQGIPLVNEDAPEVLELAGDREYEIEQGEYEDKIEFERLVLK